MLNCKENLRSWDFTYAKFLPCCLFWGLGVWRMPAIFIRLSCISNGTLGCDSLIVRGSCVITEATKVG